MFANLLHLIGGRPASPEVVRQAFVESVRLVQPESKSVRVERLMLVCWLLIAVKHVLVIWACHHYLVPFHQLWVNFPTWLLGMLATVIYYTRVLWS